MNTIKKNPIISKESVAKVGGKVSSKKIRKYTKEEDLLIFDEIENGGHKNVVDACEVLSKKINRSADAISFRWYCVISKKDKIAFASGSSKGMLVNRKNVSRKDGKMRDHVMKPLLYIIQEMVKMSKEDQKIIVRIFS